MSEHESNSSEMHIDAHRAKQLAENIQHIQQQISRASSKASSRSARPVRLIAVSKLKPANDILALHNAPVSHHHFGENYLQELQSKAAILPRSINWHFIGALQSNKCKPLAESIPNLWCVSSVDSVKKADGLEKGRAALIEATTEKPEPLRVQVQVNTSGEAEKSGVEPDEAVTLCKHIRNKCPHLRLSGLMTIGALARSQATTAETENEDFIKLSEVRDLVAKELGMQQTELELSMGMSEDFEGAIVQGSDEVRIGSNIFGQRPAKKDAKITEEEHEKGS